ncbi:MAG: hypothetical protein WCO11_06235 [Sphingomonadales bacterium]|jgi:hypothetical protein
MATAAAAVVARAQREIQHHFFAADAVRPDRAVAFAPHSPPQRRMFERWRARGIIRQCDDGRYWLDIVAYDEDLQRRHRRTRLVILVLAVVMAIELLLVWGLRG